MQSFPLKGSIPMFGQWMPRWLELLLRFRLLSQTYKNAIRLLVCLIFICPGLSQVIAQSFLGHFHWTFLLTLRSWVLSFPSSILLFYLSSSFLLPQ